MSLGRFRFIAIGILVLYGVLAIVLPFLVLVYSSLVRVYTVPTLEALRDVTLRNYSFVLSDDLTIRAIGNSLILGLASATVVVGLTAVEVAAKRSGERWHRAARDAAPFAASPHRF